MHKIAAHHLIHAWEARYTPDFSKLTFREKHLNIYKLLDLASPRGRKNTAEEVKQLLNFKCQVAGIHSNILFSYIPNIVNLVDAKRLSQSIQVVYEKVLEIYQQQPPLTFPDSFSAAEQGYLEALEVSDGFFRQWVNHAVRLTKVEQLSRELQPSIQQLREQYLSIDECRAIGFLSTQFHFSTTNILHQLQLAEQLLLSPYFKFVEEQVCIPWQRVCAAAAKYLPGSQRLILVQQLLPASGEIAINIHRRASQIYPNHHSRRGKLNHPGVQASSIRDIEMFQAYLWVCILERSMAAVENELLPLCALVFPSIDVQWELVEGIIPLLVEEFQARVEPQQMGLLQTYTKLMQKIFADYESNLK
ncbi:MAG: hypothetical protein F6K16_25615 [Symploca sp. SIO2B6]|nr:hypothetical protein [Symploca sp. SIO2B6]